MSDLLKEDLWELELWLETSYLAFSDEIVIDIRDNEKIEKDPLKIKWSTIINIPFYDINNKFETLDQSKTYLFYCERGVLSKLHALYLKEKWFNNIKIFRFENNQIKCKK
jgi:thiamine biosynthesis protein ThiI